ncbi:MAG: hypothetical protein GKR93_12610 [Gammaproteobacteria bacterium]|nr:hypothetical protein [Gammaproteobacteria bacterium]
MPDNKDDDDGDVGYKKPPKRTQFKPGQSGNKKGRPKKPDKIASHLQELLNEKISVRDSNGKVSRMTNMEAFLRNLQAKAMQGKQKELTIFYNVLKQTGYFDIPDDSKPRGGGVLVVPATLSMEDWIERYGKKPPDDDGDQ